MPEAYKSRPALAVLDDHLYLPGLSQGRFRLIGHLVPAKQPQAPAAVLWFHPELVEHDTSGIAKAGVQQARHGRRQHPMRDRAPRQDLHIPPRRSGAARPALEVAREPQWLGTKSTSRRKGEAMKGG